MPEPMGSVKMQAAHFGACTKGSVMTERLLDPEEVARYLKVPVKTLYAWRYTRTGPTALKVGKHLRYRQTDIDEWLESSAVGGSAA
jgi:excisionase family DNA binding protein